MTARVAWGLCVVIAAGCGSSEGDGGGGPGLMTSGEVGPGGGSLSLRGVGKVTFPAGAFAAPTTVTITTTADPAIAAIYDDTADIFALGPRASYEVRVNCGPVALTVPVQVELSIPREIDGDARLLALVEGASEEDALPQFEALEAATTGSALAVTLTPNLMTSRQLPDSSFEVVLTLAGSSTPTPSSPGFPTLPGTGTMTFPLQAPCAGVGLGPPLKALTVTSPFDPDRQLWIDKPGTSAVACTTAATCARDGTHQVECQGSVCKYLWVGHPGVDYRAAEGTPLFSSGEGTVIKSYRSNSFGETMLIDIPGTGQVRYAHMKVRYLQAGTKVYCGQPIGESDTTGAVRGPHLHFEYAPPGKPKVDPDKCRAECPTWSGTASEEAMLMDGLGGNMTRHIHAEVVWKPMEGMFGGAFEATGTATYSGGGTASLCNVNVRATTLPISGTLQFFQGTNMYMVTGSNPPGSILCYDHTACMPNGGGFEMCGSPPPWVSGFGVYDPTKKMIMGTSGDGGVMYSWSFSRTP